MSDSTQHTDEFRREVVRRADSGAISVSQLADELGLSTSTIYRWRRQFASEPQTDAPSSAAEQAPKGKKGKKGKMSKKGDKSKDKKKDGKNKKGKKSKKGKDGKKGKKGKKK